MSSKDPADLPKWILAITIAMALTTVVLLASSRLQAALGERAVSAFGRLMGLVLTALAVQMLLNGVQTFVATLGK